MEHTVAKQVFGTESSVIFGSVLRQLSVWLRSIHVSKWKSPADLGKTWKYQCQQTDLEVLLSRFTASPLVRDNPSLIISRLSFASCVWVLRFWIEDLLLGFRVSFFNRILHSCCCTIFSRNTEVHGKRPGSLGPWGTCDKHFFLFITMLRKTGFPSSLGPIFHNVMVSSISFGFVKFARLSRSFLLWMQILWVDWDLHVGLNQTWSIQKSREMTPTEREPSYTHFVKRSVGTGLKVECSSAGFEFPTVLKTSLESVSV